MFLGTEAISLGRVGMSLKLFIMDLALQNLWLRHVGSA